jgi:hypothetical protein
MNSEMYSDLIIPKKRDPPFGPKPRSGDFQFLRALSCGLGYVNIAPDVDSIYKCLRRRYYFLYTVSISLKNDFRHSSYGIICTEMKSGTMTVQAFHYISSRGRSSSPLEKETLQQFENGTTSIYIKAKPPDFVCVFVCC